MARVTETEVADAIVQYLTNKVPPEASHQELIRELPIGWISLSADDLAPSPTRSNETIWEQQVRNITSHRNSPGNAIYEGRLVAIGGGFRLPERAAA